MSAQDFKASAIRTLPDVAGVYALCDLDEVPVYVGQATKSKHASIRKRVQRHLTSARSDVIANRQIDVWEIAYVWAWPTVQDEHRGPLEAFLFHQFNDDSPLVNGSIPARPDQLEFSIPFRLQVQVMESAEIEVRRDPSLRFPRLVAHFGNLIDYILNTQDKPHLRRALQVYFDRLSRYYREFVVGP